MARQNSVHVALLRGINVGGRNRLPMKDLVGLYQRAGCEDVRTLIQSGNVVFRAPATIARSLSAAIAAGIEKHFGLAVPVVQRSLTQLRRIAAAHPLARGAAEEALHVGFLAARPTAAKVAALDPQRSPPDTFEVRGSEIYLCLPGGAARTRLTNDWFDRNLGTTITVRNWKTTRRLLELAESV